MEVYHKQMSRSRKRKRPRRRKRRAEAKAYPSPAERTRIIERRDKLLWELTEILIMPQENQRKLNRLIRRYGPQEVQLVLETFQKRASSAELISNEASVYRAYRLAFARFGGDRPFLSAQEYSDLSLEHAKLNIKRTFKAAISGKPSTRERELRDLLLIDATWDDITPPAVPPRPSDFDAPPTGAYDYPVRTLLEWGWDLDDERAKNNARNTNKWWPAIEDLARMALDGGLLNGWPGERASWAPYHALNMLGRLRAHQVAGRLLGLLGQENDWLSDRLAVAWGQMGPQAEPPLWEYVDVGRASVKNAERGAEQRAIVMLGLANIAEANPKRWSSIIGKLTDLLRHASADDAEANAYIVYLLERLEATEAADAIVDAFEQGKVDTKIIDLESVSILDWDDPALYDRLYGSDEE